MEATERAMPLYARIAEELRANVLTLKPGEAMETEQELVNRYGASRGTIRQAIDNLVREGLIVREKGRGTFRTKKDGDQEIYYISGISSRTILEFGSYSGIRNLSSTLVRATAALADELHIPHGSQVRRISRIRTLNGRSCVIGVAYVRADLLPKFKKEQYRTSLIDMLETTYRLRLCDRSCACAAVPANEWEAAELNVQEGAPLLEARLTCSAAGKGPLMIDTFHFRPDFRLFLEVGKAIRIGE